MTVNKKQKVAAYSTIAVEILVPVLIVCGVPKNAMISISIACVLFCMGQFGIEPAAQTPKGFIYWFAKVRSCIWYMLAVYFFTGVTREKLFDLFSFLVFVTCGLLIGTFEYFVQLETPGKEGEK